MIFQLTSSYIPVNDLLLSNQTIFMRECYNVTGKSCVILFLPEKGLCSVKKSEEIRQYFETSFETFALKQKIRNQQIQYISRRRIHGMNDQGKWDIGYTNSAFRAERRGSMC